MSAQSQFNKPLSSTSTGSTSEQLTQTAESASQAIRDTASSMAEQGSEMAHQAQAAASDAYTSVRRFAEEQPLLAIAATAAAVIAAGALLARLSRPSRSQALFSQLADVVEPHYRTLRRKL